MAFPSITARCPKYTCSRDDRSRRNCGQLAVLQCSNWDTTASFSTEAGVAIYPLGVRYRLSLTA
eukprot:2797810-Amphidinium_carterae.1